jgi:hypothetical protein
MKGESSWVTITKRSCFRWLAHVPDVDAIE